jgi:hypothetical protein
MQTSTRRLGRSALVLADAWAVNGLMPDWPVAWRHLRAPHAWIAKVGPDSAAVELGCLALWCLAAWLAAGLVSAGCTQLPGRCGRLFSGITDLLLPGVVRRLLAGTAGLGLLLAPVTAGADPLGPGPSHGPGAPPSPVAWQSPAAAPSWPVNAGSTRAAPDGTSPVDRPSSGHPATVRPKAPPHRPDTTLVRPGDSLWLIAARRLGPASNAETVAELWPRWYATNRTVIGGDPGLIYPGQLLNAPQTPHMEAP